MIYKLIVFTSLFSFFSCSSYVQQWHQHLEKKQGQNEKIKKKFITKSLTQRPARGPASVRKRPLAKKGPGNIKALRPLQNVPPSIRRKYMPKRKRNRISDLYDNKNEGSLWSGLGQESYLFARNNIKKSGDIVVINVQGKLKKDISLELDRTSPRMFRNNRQNKQNQNKNPPQENNDNKVYDKMSAIVVEEINQDHLLIKARKDLLYNQRKRHIEVQALIARRDIGDADTINSSKILESNISILR